ncbi:MAG: membrane protein insertion efficiency factor YidD [Chloroflexi bacterium]|nr:membrane protein insertion efficiency factor YidD [Chloroflexota bacterium]
MPRIIYGGLIRIYQVTTSFFPPVCRFQPTCSEYSRQAVLKHGIMKGLWFTLLRLGRCHPGHPGGYDPVP